jgi:cysteinyl-tRNA synthetase
VKARKNYLFDEYVKKNLSLDKLVEDANEALKLTQEKANNEQDKDKKEMYNKSIAKANETLENIISNRGKQDVDEAQKLLLANSADILSTWLDKLDGKNVTDNSIFSKLPRHFEGEFHKDMAALNVVFILFLN